MANDAPVLLADEPTGELDTVNAKIVVDYLVKVNRELGKTIIMVTHDPSVARVAHRILRIEDGVIKMALTPSEVIVQEKAVSYTDQLKARISEINVQLQQLDRDFRNEKMDGDEYTEKRQSLKQIKRQPQRRIGANGRSNITNKNTNSSSTSNKTCQSRLTRVNLLTCSSGSTHLSPYDSLFI